MQPGSFSVGEIFLGSSHVRPDSKLGNAMEDFIKKVPKISSAVLDDQEAVSNAQGHF